MGEEAARQYAAFVASLWELSGSLGALLGFYGTEEGASADDASAQAWYMVLRIYRDVLSNPNSPNAVRAQIFAHDSRRAVSVLFPMLLQPKPDGKAAAHPIMPPPI